MTKIATILSILLLAPACAGQDAEPVDPTPKAKASISDTVGAMEKRDLEDVREARPSTSRPELSAEQIRAIVDDLRRGSTYVKAARAHGSTVGQAKSIERARKRRLSELAKENVEVVEK